MLVLSVRQRLKMCSWWCGTWIRWADGLRPVVWSSPGNEGSIEGITHQLDSEPHIHTAAVVMGNCTFSILPLITDSDKLRARNHFLFYKVEWVLSRCQKHSCMCWIFNSCQQEYDVISVCCLLLLMRMCTYVELPVVGGICQLQVVTSKY